MLKLSQGPTSHIGISVTLPDNASEDKGDVLVAKQPLAFMLLDAHQGHSVV